MPKHLIRRYIPHREVIKNHRHLRLFGDLLHDPNLWHLNRRSVAGAFAVGLFWAMIPVPLQMVAAAATAILCRVNLPLSIALVWITNPLTMPPLFYGCYRFGNWLLGRPPSDLQISLSWEWFTQSIGEIWQPLYLGSLVIAIIAALAGYCAMRAFWRWYVIQRLRKRQASKGTSVPSRS